MVFRPTRDQLPRDITQAGRVNVRGQPAPVGPLAPQMVLLPPSYFPPRNSRRVFSQASATVSAAGGPQVVATVALLPHEIAVISDIEIGISAMVVTSVVTWTIRCNGVAINWGPLSIIPRAALYAGDAWGNLGLEVPIGTNIVDVLATVVDAGTYLIGASITGWAWPPALEQAMRERRAG